MDDRTHTNILLFIIYLLMLTLAIGLPIVHWEWFDEQEAPVNSEMAGPRG